MKEVIFIEKESEFLTKSAGKISNMMCLLRTLERLKIVKNYHSQRFSSAPTAYRIMVKTEHEVWK